MKMRKFSIKKVLLIFGAIFLLCIVLEVVIYQLRIPILEYEYKKEPTAENLIKLSIELIDAQDYDKMMQYLPLTAELDNFSEISESNELFLMEYSDYEDKSAAAKRTYQTVIVQNALSYIYAEKYNDFYEKFPELYREITLNDAYSKWIAIIEKQNKITKEGYENILRALKENAPPLVEVTPENAEPIREYAINLIMQMPVYWKIGDEDKVNKLFTEYQSLMKELNSVMKE